MYRFLFVVVKAIPRDIHVWGWFDCRLPFFFPAHYGSVRGAMNDIFFFIRLKGETVLSGNVSVLSAFFVQLLISNCDIAAIFYFYYEYTYERTTA